MSGWMQEIAGTFRGHLYVVRYEPWEWRAVLRLLGRWASDPEHEIDWRDVGTLSAQVYRNRNAVESRNRRGAEARR